MIHALSDKFFFQFQLLSHVIRVDVLDGGQRHIGVGSAQRNFPQMTHADHIERQITVRAFVVRRDARQTAQLLKQSQSHHRNALRPQFGQFLQIQMLQRVDAERMLLRTLRLSLQPCEQAVGTLAVIGQPFPQFVHLFEAQTEILRRSHRAEYRCKEFQPHLHLGHVRIHERPVLIQYRLRLWIFRVVLEIIEKVVHHFVLPLGPYGHLMRVDCTELLKRGQQIRQQTQTDDHTAIRSQIL